MNRDDLRFWLAKRASRVDRIIRSRLGLEATVYVGSRAAEYRAYWQEGARLLGAEFISFRDDIWEVRRGERRVRLAIHQTPFDDPATRRLAGDKGYCYGLARQVGVPVTPFTLVSTPDLQAAREFVAREPGPYVVKPARDSASGLGVTTQIPNWSGVVRAGGLAANYDRQVIVERMAAGESCRLLFLGGRLIHAVRRRGTRVIGDGVRPISALLPAGSRTALERRTIAFTLAAQGLAPTTVPGLGVEVLASGLPPGSGATELRTIYDETVTPLCSPNLADELGGVVRALGSDFAGIDIVTNDLGRRLADSGGTFLEINTSPGIHHHYLTASDQGPDPVAKLVLARLLDGPA